MALLGWWFIAKQYSALFVLSRRIFCRTVSLMAKPVPLLIISDAPSSGTGLGRICRDIASRVHTHMKDVYRVATLGYGGPGTREFGFPQYNIEGMQSWITPNLPQVAEDWFGDETGILMFIWDASRVSWFSQPRGFAELTAQFPALQQWLFQMKHKKWIYAPIDAEGLNGKLTFPLMQTLLGFDRILAYGPFGEGVIRRTIGDEESDNRGLTNLPHGIDTDIFFPMNRGLCRKLFLQKTRAEALIGPTLPIDDYESLVGIVATNNPRKNWALGLEAVAKLSQDRKLRLWLHVDTFDRYWSIPSLLVDLGLIDKTVVSLGHLSDDNLAVGYSACDVTMGIGPEGFGLPLIESQACGTPVVTGSYAGGSDIVPKAMQIEPYAFYHEGLYSTRRPVFDSGLWAKMANQWIGTRVEMDPQYDWVNLWPRFEEWFREGL